MEGQTPQAEPRKERVPLGTMVLFEYLDPKPHWRKGEVVAIPAEVRGTGTRQPIVDETVLAIKPPERRDPLLSYFDKINWSSFQQLALPERQEGTVVEIEDFWGLPAKGIVVSDAGYTLFVRMPSGEVKLLNKHHLKWGPAGNRLIEAWWEGEAGAPPPPSR